MITIDIDILFLLYLGSGFLLLFTLWFYSEWRDSHRFEAHEPKVVYHCIKCSCVYTGSYKSNELECPECGFINGRLRF